MSPGAVVRGTTTATTGATAIRPTTTTTHKICSPQIFVLPPNMFVSGLGSGNNSNKMFVSSLNNSNNNNNNTGVRTLMSVGNNFQKRQVQIMSRPAEKVMRPLNLKRPLVASPSLDSGSSDEDEDSKDGLLTGEERRVRKRANLDHLSSEEKMMRRKLKNRVAAQNARDKKRVKMEEMEVTIQQLEKQNQALVKKNENLAAENRLLVAENAKLRNANILTFAPMTSFTPLATFSPDVIVKVKEEEEEIALPFSPASLPVTPSHSISDVEEDSDSAFVSTLNNNNNYNNIFVDAGRNSNSSNNPRSPVVSRFRGPAEPTNDLQPKEQNRVPAVERRRMSPSTLLPSHLALLIWIHLLGPLHVTSSQMKQQQKFSFKTEAMEKEATRCQSSTTALMIPLLNFNLPPKKRSHWWGAHRPSPHAKT